MITIIIPIIIYVIGFPYYFDTSINLEANKIINNITSLSCPENLINGPRVSICTVKIDLAYSEILQILFPGITQLSRSSLRDQKRVYYHIEANKLLLIRAFCPLSPKKLKIAKVEFIYLLR